MSSLKYEELEDDFHTNIEEIEKIFNTKISRLNGEPRKHELRNADKFIEDAESELAQMFEEAQIAPGSHRTTLLSRSRGYKAQLEKLRKEYKKALAAGVKNEIADNRNELIGATHSHKDPNNILRNKMVEGLASLDRGSQSVARSERVAAETDEIGVQIIGDLDDQRESLLRTKDKLKETDSDLSRSRKILTNMAIKVSTNKLLLVVIIVLEVVVIGAIVYFRFIKK